MFFLLTPTIQLYVTSATNPWNSTQVPNQTFQLQLVASAVSNLRPRQDDALGFLDFNGDVERLCQSATEHYLQNGRLLSGSLSFSTSPDASSSPFSASQEQGSIDTTFSVAGGQLTWENSAFEGGAARFFSKQSQPILPVFAGPAPEGYTAVCLRNTPRKLHLVFCLWSAFWCSLPFI